jgi:acetoacetyl-CoA synthetase
MSFWDGKILWQPTPHQIKNSQMTKFLNLVRKDYPWVETYQDLYRFSIEYSEDFWKRVWTFTDIIAETQGDRVIENTQEMEKARFFPQAKLNFAQNLLRRRDQETAIYFFGEDKVTRELSFSSLYNQVSSISQFLKDIGIQAGDRVAGYLPNLPETVIAMLSATTLGAVWSSCSPDFGVQGVVDRFGQILPKVLFVADGYYYNGKIFSCLEKIPEILVQIPSIQKVVIVPYAGSSAVTESWEDKRIFWDSLLEKYPFQEISFQSFPFNHPLYIMYSSGTTGVPKCIIHGVGGTLLQHLKEHQLHCNIKPNDRVFYFTTCGWMMWNWLMTALASKASLVLFDGSPTYPSPDFLFKIADKIGITLFGTSAKYLDILSKSGVEPIKTYPLKKLEVITSTGSPLSPEGFDYVYQSIKKNVQLSSIAGGTDIISCFMQGNPIGPVYRGELQVRALGMKVEVFDEDGNAVVGEKGELVCTAPFPCQPLGFWNDPDGQKYHNAYFARYKNTWHHGDFIELTPHGGVIIYGRSDTILNPGGVRIGTAEIYRQIEKIDEVEESIVIGQEWDNDVRVILFVKLKDEFLLTEDLISRIKKKIRINASPRHVPAKIIQVPDIPKTKNGKLAELAVRNVIHGQIVKNKESLMNPECLDFYKNLFDLEI